MSEDSTTKTSLDPEEQLLMHLKASLATHARSATFACGGNVLIDGATEPVQIRFGESGTGVTILFPGSTAESAEFKALLKACQPASFGRRGENVLDEEYRKAGKLDRAEFATSFCPYEVGIIDVVSQLLLPQTKHSKDSRSIRAELYKLNIYSGPNGKFKAHVDTPRSEAQLGSLVVSLPIAHKGGQLAIRNAGKELVFDMSVSGHSKDIKWAAFYSDCEHEVYEVTSGHRVTLTYNLFLTRGLGHLAGIDSALDPIQLPLYKHLATALDNRDFFRHGRALAIWLTHSYAHTNKHINFLPSSLKGADMSLYETARALGLRCIIGPVIAEDGYDYDYGGPIDLMSAKFFPFNACDNGSGNLDPECGNGFGNTMPPGKVTWVNPLKTVTTKYGRKKVAKDPDDLKEPQMAYMTYGNEPGIAIHYSRAAMLVRIPPFRERGRPFDVGKKFYEGIRDDNDEEWYCDSCDDEDDEDVDEEESDDE